MMKRCIVLIGLFSANLAAQTTQPAPRLKPLSELLANRAARDAFLDVENYARRPAEEQKRNLAVFYRFTTPNLMLSSMEKFRSIPTNIYEKNSWKVPPEDEFAPVYVIQLKSAFGTSHTPEELATAIMEAHNDPDLFTIIAKQRAIDVLRSNRETLVPLMKEDIASGNFDRSMVAFNVVKEVEMVEMAEAVLDVYLVREDRRSEAAKYSLLWAHLPRLGKRLVDEVEKDSEAVHLHCDLLAVMLKDEPAPATLLKLLESPKVELRRDAAKSLVASGDAALAPYVTKLVGDRDYELKLAISKIAFSLPDAAFLKVRLDLMSLLYAQKGVQYQTMWGFAQRRDVAATGVMLDLMKLNNLDPVGIAEVRRSFEAITQDELDFDIQNWGPGNARNDRAIKEFEEWLDENRGKLANGSRVKTTF